MRLKFLALMLVLVVGFSACTPATEEGRLEEGEALLRQREYEEAALIFRELVDKDPLNYDAWHELVKALYRDKEYKDAAEALEGYYEAVRDDYKKNDEVSYEPLIKDIIAYGRELEGKGQRVGSWMEALNPPMVDTSMIPYSMELGQTFELEVPKGTTVYYTMDGSEPDITDSSQKYTGPVTIKEAGEYTLTVVAVNDFGIPGDSNWTWISAYDLPPVIYPNLAAGEYDGPVTVFFEEYDSGKMDLYYTTDGSDPSLYGFYYDEYSGIQLNSGEIILKAVYYDYESGQYSKESETLYTVTSPYNITEYTELTVALFGLTEGVAAEVDFALSNINNTIPNAYIYYYRMDDLEMLKQDLASGYVDLVYGPADYVEDFASAGGIVPVTNNFDMFYDDYYGKAPDAGYYEGDFYCLPVVISPNMLLYFNTMDTANDYYYDIDTWDQLVALANSGDQAYNFLYPEDIIGEWLLAFYLGYGGTISPLDGGGFLLDEQPLIDAMTFAYNLPVTYGLGFEGMDTETYTYAIEDGSATMLFGHIYDIEAYDYNYIYGTAGPMPLPNGSYATGINRVDGLMVGPYVFGDSNKEALTNLLYDTLAQGAEANYIASAAESIPAYYSAVNDEYLNLRGDIMDYEHAVDSSITIPYTYALLNLMDSLTYEMQNVLYGSTAIGDAARNIMDLYSTVQ